MLNQLQNLNTLTAILTDHHDIWFDVLIERLSPSQLNELLYLVFNYGFPDNDDSIGCIGLLIKENDCAAISIKFNLYRSSPDIGGVNATINNFDEDLLDYISFDELKENWKELYTAVKLFG